MVGDTKSHVSGNAASIIQEFTKVGQDNSHQTVKDVADTVLPGVVPFLASSEAHVNRNAFTTVEEFLREGTDPSQQTAKHIRDTVLPGVVPLLSTEETYVSKSALNIVHEFLKMGKDNSAKSVKQLAKHGVANDDVNVAREVVKMLPGLITDVDVADADHGPAIEALFKVLKHDELDQLAFSALQRY